MVPEEGRITEARWFCPWELLRPERELLLSERLLPDDRLLPPERPLLPEDLLLSDDLPLPAVRLPVLACLFWFVLFDFIPLLRRAVEDCAMVC